MLSDNQTQELKICFISLTAYSLISGKDTKNIIGPDVNIVNLAKELVKRDYNVTFLTYDEGGSKKELIDGITVLKTYNPLKTNILVNIIILCKTIFKANSDIYFHFGGFFGILSIIPLIMGKRSVYRIASDAFVDRNIITVDTNEFKKSKLSIDTISNYINLKFSSAIIVQTREQERKLQKYKKKLYSNKNNFPIKNTVYKKKENPPIILWVGSIAGVKQPQIFLELAKRIPEAKFVMIGGHKNNEIFYDEIKRQAAELSNFDFMGVVEFNEIDQHFQRASMLVNTSLFEGYPNSFIQAWNNYTPVISLNADPDEIICKFKLGFHSLTFNQLVNDVKWLLTNNDLLKDYGCNGKNYVLKEFRMEDIIDQYVRLFNKLAIID